MKPLSTLSVAELRSLREECPHRATEINEELRNRCEEIIALNYPYEDDDDELNSSARDSVRSMRRDFAT